MLGIGNIIEQVQGLISPEMRDYNEQMKVYRQQTTQARGWAAGYGYDVDQLTEAEDKDNRNWLLKLALVGVLSFTPFLPKSVPDGLKTFALLASTISCGVFYAQEQSQKTLERRKSLYNYAGLRQDRRQQAATHQQVFDRKVAEVKAYNRLIAFGNQLPMEQRRALFAELELEHYMPQEWQVQRPAAGGGVQFLGSLPNQTLALPGSNIDPLVEASNIYMDALGVHGKRKNFFFLGGMGDTKTVTAHFALWNYINDAMLTAHKSGGKIQPPVIMAFDPHYGRNDDPNYISTWCGLPYLGKETPKTLKNCAFKGTAESLYPFLKLAYDEFVYRRDNEIPFDARPPVLIIIDEFSNLMGDLDKDMQEKISKLLKKLGTESRKFGVNYWIVGHSCTKTDIGLERIVLRGCSVIVGYGILTDSSQMANLPHAVLDDGIAEVKTRKLSGIDFPGFATNLSAAPYVPPSPLNTIEMEFKWDAGMPAYTPPSTVAEEEEEGEMESLVESLRRMREGLVQMRLWWDIQPGNPTEDQVILMWSRFSGDSVATSKENVKNIRGVMGLSEEVFNERIDGIDKQIKEQESDG